MSCQPTTNILHLPLLNHALTLLSTLLLTLLTTLTTTTPPFTQPTTTPNPYHLLNATPHTASTTLTTTYHHLLNKTTTPGWLHTLIQTLAATTNNDMITNNNKNAHFHFLVSKDEEMYRIAYETLTDPFQRCVYHRASNTAEWYGLVPVFCWGEGGVGWLMRAKEAVGEWGVDAAAAVAVATISNVEHAVAPPGNGARGTLEQSELETFSL